MSFWDWIRSAIIFVSAVFILNDFFISLTILEAVILTIFMVICVVHTMDVRDDIIQRINKRRNTRETKKNGGTNENGAGSTAV